MFFILSSGRESDCDWFNFPYTYLIVNLPLYFMMSLCKMSWPTKRCIGDWNGWKPIPICDYCYPRVVLTVCCFNAVDFSQIIKETFHSSPVRARYGVSFVSSNSHFYSTSVSAVMRAISCYIGLYMIWSYTTISSLTLHWLQAVCRNVFSGKHFLTLNVIAYWPILKLYFLGKWSLYVSCSAIPHPPGGMLLLLNLLSEYLIELVVDPLCCRFAFITMIF